MISERFDGVKMSTSEYNRVDLQDAYVYFDEVEPALYFFAPSEHI